MAELIWTKPALADLDKIADYIALSNLPAAKELVGAGAYLKLCTHQRLSFLQYWDC